MKNYLGPEKAGKLVFFFASLNKGDKDWIKYLSNLLGLFTQLSYIVK